MVVSNRNLLFQGSIFRFHVCFGGSIPIWPDQKGTNEAFLLEIFVGSPNFMAGFGTALASQEVQRHGKNDRSYQLLKFGVLVEKTWGTK